MFSKRSLFLLIVIATQMVAVSSFWGCAGKSVDENDPAAMMADAEEDIKSDHYQIALEKLRTVKNKFPYSKYSSEALLRISDVYFMQESYGEAALSYESFKDLHPKHEKVPYAMYRMSKSYYNDMPSSVHRDLSSGKKAEDAYSEFLKRFPNAPEAAEARRDLKDARNRLALKEMDVAEFYMHWNSYRSARARFKKLLEMYPDCDVATSAQNRLVDAEKRIAETNTAR